MPCLPSTSISRILRPAEASARARAAATVVLPVPPLPVTTCHRTPYQSVSLVVMASLPPVRSPASLSPTEYLMVRLPQVARDPFVTTLGSRKRGDPGGCSCCRHRDPGHTRDYRGLAHVQGGAAVREGHHLPVRPGPAGDTRSRADYHPADRRPDGEG